MIVPERYYHRIADLSRRFENVPHRVLLASTTMERLLADLSENERREVRRLLEKGLDETGMLNPARLSKDERAFIHSLLADGVAELMRE
jgi:hypothetical protein